MEYQHHVSIWNYTTGKVTRGCFRSRVEAELFYLETEGQEKTHTSELSDWPYGTFTQDFDNAARLARMTDHNELEGVQS